MKTKRNPVLGRIVGKLTVIEEIPEHVKYSSNPWVKCKCECGKEHQVRFEHLKEKYINSCGCSRRKSKVVGQTYGVWTYLEEVENPNRKGVFWKIQCKCGFSKITNQKPSSSSGCINCFPRSKRPNLSKQEKFKTIHGYVKILKPNHPRSDSQGYVLEHIDVMEQKVGRFVVRSESVHHINGQRDDNRIENLELWDKAHPSGQRNSEKMEFYMKELEAKCDIWILLNFCKKIIIKLTNHVRK